MEQQQPDNKDWMSLALGEIWDKKLSQNTHPKSMSGHSLGSKPKGRSTYLNLGAPQACRGLE